MRLRKKGRILTILALVAELVLIIVGIIYRQQINQDFALVSGSGFDNSTVLEIRLEQPSFPTSFADFETLGFEVASTGRVYKHQLKDSNSGEVLGEAVILETVSRDRGDPGDLLKLPLIVQFAPRGNPDRNTLPWILEEAAELRSSFSPSDAVVLSKNQIKEIFPRGTLWSFIPLVNLGEEYLDQTVELSSYAQKYYGGTTHPQIEKLFQDSPDQHPLLGGVSIPIFILGIFEYLPAE